MLNQKSKIGVHMDFFNRTCSQSLHLSMSGEKKFRIRNPLPQEVGRGTAEFTSISQKLAYSHYKCSNTVQEFHTRMELLSDQFKFTFHLSPDPGLVGIDGLPGKIRLNPGDSYILGPSVIGTQEIIPGRVVHELSLFIDPNLLHSILSDTSHRIPSIMEPCFQEPRKKPFYLTGWTSPEMKICIRQLLGCTLTGNLGRIYAESKVLELITLRLDQQLAPLSSIKKMGLMKRDVEILNKVRDCLNQDFINPPSITEIAHIAGINTTKLKNGFKELFGLTIFSYIRTMRMESALQLIQDGECSVGEAANRVGYNSNSAFIRAFEAEYGVSPGSFRPGGSIRQTVLE